MAYSKNRARLQSDPGDKIEYEGKVSGNPVLCTMVSALRKAALVLGCLAMQDIWCGIGLVTSFTGNLANVERFGAATTLARRGVW